MTHAPVADESVSRRRRRSSTLRRHRTQRGSSIRGRIAGHGFLRRLARCHPEAGEDKVRDNARRAVVPRDAVPPGCDVGHPEADGVMDWPGSAWNAPSRGDGVPGRQRVQPTGRPIWYVGTHGAEGLRRLGLGFGVARVPRHDRRDRARQQGCDVATVPGGTHTRIGESACPRTASVTCWPARPPAGRTQLRVASQSWACATAGHQSARPVRAAMATATSRPAVLVVSTPGSTQYASSRSRGHRDRPAPGGPNTACSRPPAYPGRSRI